MAMKIQSDVSVEAGQCPIREVAVWSSCLLITEIKAALLPLDGLKIYFAEFILANHSSNYSQFSKWTVC